jgi:CRISPR/Cas system-associated endoribonuclease Cas2
MSKVTVYQFTKYDISVDGNRKSRRWATREAIERVGGNVFENTATEVDHSVLSKEIDGMTERNFDPHPRTGFQTQA